MFDRLKSLPLTILLTILIWMYAESQVNHVDNQGTLVVHNVPILVSGPPDVLARFTVDVHPQFIDLTVSGAPAAIEGLSQRLATDQSSDPTANAGLYACLDVSADDRPDARPSWRHLRYVPPEGLSIKSGPLEVQFALIERPASSAPGAK